ncbi:hypothetical protein J1614_010541 [Plenodomus biglobosus]|nr:hypothetical protein J1614_010541 [Plenodomus biglobosus]
METYQWCKIWDLLHNESTCLQYLHKSRSAINQLSYFTEVHYNALYLLASPHCVCSTYCDDQPSFYFLELSCPQQDPIMIAQIRRSLHQPPRSRPHTPPPQLQLVQPRQQVIQPVKTVYITSFSSDRVKRDINGKSTLEQAIPFGVPAVLTVWCQTWQAPVKEICDMYSGVSPQVQEVILGSRTATRHM